MISDDDIFENMKILQEKVDGVNIKIKEGIKESSEYEPMDNIIPNIKFDMYIAIFITVIATVVATLLYIRPKFVLVKNNIDKFLFNDELSILLLVTYTFVFSSLIFLFIYGIAYKST